MPVPFCLDQAGVAPTELEAKVKANGTLFALMGNEELGRRSTNLS
mgnify:CR=1 FL=1